MASSWNALAAPSKTPAPVIARLNQEITAAVNNPDVAKKLRELNVQRSLRLQVTQQYDGFWLHAFYGFKDWLEVAVGITEEEDFGLFFVHLEPHFSF